MKKILTSLVVLLLLSACKPSPEDYLPYKDIEVDGYAIYTLDQGGLFCNSEYADIYYSGPVYNYGFTFTACSHDMNYFIKVNDEFMFLGEAINQDIVSLDSLLPYLEEIPRESEEFESDEADYYWLDFHINHEVVYAYAGGECDQAGSEIFEINGTTYSYHATGCLKDHILYMKDEGMYIPVATLLANGTIDGEYLIPLLDEE
ncbi:hypothetical protein [Candidatus Xianfuyuplasma coldseepsis]|uniref:Lipoprotein n=1 Tax=Candidatus Xianfuyuplasma coldseepsis TaxID=2782163 RepID=A0A7L7KR21_9MOLU|nr:hypothetical protein [Xianfuyuplasma coldseepsis]QMS84666.1 hypothetical protein G4Z02_02505 [Xianfuyuplasma coldseepsis]